MDDGVASTDGLLDEGAIRDVADDAFNRTVLKRSDDIVKGRSIVVTVEKTNIVSVLEQVTRGPRADEAVTAGDENLHAVIRLMDVAANAREVFEHRVARCSRVAGADCIGNCLEIAVRTFERPRVSGRGMDRVCKHFAYGSGHPEKHTVAGRLKKRPMKCECGIGKDGRVGKRSAHFVERRLK